MYVYFFGKKNRIFYRFKPNHENFFYKESHFKNQTVLVVGAKFRIQLFACCLKLSYALQNFAVCSLCICILDNETNLVDFGPYEILCAGVQVNDALIDPVCDPG